MSTPILNREKNACWRTPQRIPKHAISPAQAAAGMRVGAGELWRHDTRLIRVYLKHVGIKKTGFCAESAAERFEGLW
ncbi:MAG: hypothetical protein ACYDHM_15350 [Acidiferrobacterales bacterium]